MSCWPFEGFGRAPGTPPNFFLLFRVMYDLLGDHIFNENILPSINVGLVFVDSGYGIWDLDLHVTCYYMYIGNRLIIFFPPYGSLKKVAEVWFSTILWQLIFWEPFPYTDYNILRCALYKVKITPKSTFYNKSKGISSNAQSFFFIKWLNYTCSFNGLPSRPWLW